MIVSHKDRVCYSCYSWDTQQRRVPSKQVTATLHTWRSSPNEYWSRPTKTGCPTCFKRTWNLFISNPLHLKLSSVAKISRKCDYAQHKLTWRHEVNIEDDSRSKVRSFMVLVITSECVLCMSFVRPLLWIDPMLLYITFIDSLLAATQKW